MLLYFPDTALAEQPFEPLVHEPAAIGDVDIRETAAHVGNLGERVAEAGARNTQLLRLVGSADQFQATANLLEGDDLLADALFQLGPCGLEGRKFPTQPLLVDIFVLGLGQGAVDEAGFPVEDTQDLLLGLLPRLPLGHAGIDVERLDRCGEQQFERAAELRDEEEALKQEREEAEKKWEEDTSKTVQNVTVEDIADVVSMSTGVPVSNLTEAETEKLLRMEGVLHERIIGQDEAVTALSKAIRRSRSGLKDPKRPAGSFIFLGPSGVGKTELSKALAEFLFNSEDALLSFDMSEYMEKHTVSRLVGSPPGYVGFDEGGQLTKAVRQRPYSVVLFDEIEKAHPDVFNILLQILEEGRLTDAQGRTVDFRNTVIIMTSNVGARDITTTTTLGFSNSGQNGLSDKEIKSRVMHELKNAFRPEFLNRIDEIIVFRQLTEENIRSIARRMLDIIGGRMAQQGITLQADDDAVAALAKDGFDARYGARPLRRTLQTEVEDAVAEQMLEGKLQSGDTAHVCLKDGKVVIEK